jgi:hypothetical protein
VAESQMCELTVYDPRSTDRTFKLPDGESWSSSGSRVLFFESDDYSTYTSSEFLKKLLSSLAVACQFAKIGLRTPDTNVISSLEFADERLVSQNVAFAVIDVALLDRFIERFERAGDYGVWDFYGLPPGFQDLGRLKAFPEVLTDVDRFEFVIEVDLDGILMGYARPINSEFDQLIEELKRICTLEV